MVDRDRWHFTNNEKYTVNYPDREKALLIQGPNVTLLKVFS